MGNQDAHSRIFSGPATEALERCKKRRRPNAPSCCCEALETATPFRFDDFLSDLCSEQEAFPTISWSFDDDEVVPTAFRSTPEPTTRKTLGIKRSRTGGLFRSKSFKQGLSELDSGSLQDKLSALDSKVEPLASLTKIQEEPLIAASKVIGAANILISRPPHRTKLFDTNSTSLLSKSLPYADYKR